MSAVEKAGRAAGAVAAESDQEKRQTSMGERERRVSFNIQARSIGRG